MEEQNQPEAVGTPSRGLQEVLDGASGIGGILDESPGYEPITEGAPEEGIFTLVGGYVDPDGTVHNEVHLRAMGGHEEDLMGNRNVPIIQRMNGILSNCIVRLGDITEKGKFANAVHKMPSGSRTHLLIALRRTSHYKTEKDIYEMDLECPNGNCEHVGHYKVDLSELELYDWPEPGKMEYDTKLPYSGETVTWHFITGAEDHYLAELATASEAEFLSFAILVRLTAWDGVDCRLFSSDILDSNGKKIRLSRKAKELLLRVKNLSTGDREALRAQFLDHEPGVDTELEIECEKCHREFTGRLDVTQRAFFFPRATSARSKRRRST